MVLARRVSKSGLLMGLGTFFAGKRPQQHQNCARTRNEVFSPSISDREAKCRLLSRLEVFAFWHGLRTLDGFRRHGGDDLERGV